MWRTWYYELAFGGLLEQHRDRLKATVTWAAPFDVEQPHATEAAGRATVKGPAMATTVDSALGGPPGCR